MERFIIFFLTCTSLLMVQLFSPAQGISYYVSKDGSDYLKNPSYTQKFVWDHNSWTTAQNYAAGPNDVLTNSNFVKNTGWQELTGVISAENFRLTKGNNAINAGINLYNVFNYDFFQNRRPSVGQWDMGALMSDPSVYVKPIVNEPISLKLYPNPVTNGNLQLEFEVHKTGTVQVNIFNMQGQAVMTLINQHMSPGTHSRNIYISEVPPGIYLIGLQTGTRFETRKIVVTSE